MTTLKTNGTDLTLAELQSGTWSNELAEATDILVPMQEIESDIDSARGTVTINDADTTWGTLAEKLSASSGLSVEIVDTGSGSLQLRVNLDSKLVNLLVNLTADGDLLHTGIDTSGLTEGEYLVVGAGNTLTSAPDSGVIAPLNQTITAGEALLERDLVYRDVSNGKYYKVDIDAVPIRASDRVGMVVETGGIAQDAIGDVTFIGSVSGFTGLTAGQPVYASNVAGGVSQTIPTISDGGSQVAIIYIGEATSSTEIIIHGVSQFKYFKRETLANDATLTIDHHIDDLGYRREARAYVAGSDTPLIIGRWVDGSPDIGVQYGDISSTLKSTKTSFKNRSGGSLDIVCVVEVSH